MNCENCNLEIKTKYGSGRFCDAKCARSFSSKAKRLEINEKVSKKLKGRPCAHQNGFKKGFDARRRPFSQADRRKSVEVCSDNRLKFYKSASWNELPLLEKRRRVYNDQDGKCLICGINEWAGKAITLELDHINGDHYDNKRDNVRYLCPNCHSQTPTFRNQKRNHQSTNADVA
jgi:hypothetical protein